MENRIDKKKDKADKLSNFAAVLTQLRKERGISQKKAALDVSARHFSVIMKRV